MRYKGVTIAELKTVRYEVRDATGRVLKRASKIAQAKAYIDGYLSALKQARKDAGADPEPHK